MVVKCAECGGKVSSEATACPHCGAPVKLSIRKGGSRRNYDDSEEEDAFVPPEPKFDFVVFLVGFLKICFLMLTILVLFSAILFFTIRYDLGGLRTGLRKIADSDSGSGSHVDHSNTRVMFKYYLGVVLDSVEVKPAKPDEKQLPPEKESSVIGEPEQSPPPKKNDSKKEPAVLERVERKPIELPPPPPQE